MNFNFFFYKNYLFSYEEHIFSVLIYFLKIIFEIIEMKLIQNNIKEKKNQGSISNLLAFKKEPFILLWEKTTLCAMLDLETL